MPEGRVRFVFSDGQEVEVEGFSQLNVLAHAQIAERSLQSRCGGQAECATCRIELIEGRLSPMREAERRLLSRVKDPGAKTRLACQAFPASSLVVLKVPSRAYADARDSKP